MATHHPFCIFTSLIIFLTLFNPTHVTATANTGKPAATSPNPFTAKAALLRYWARKIPAGTRRPDFLVSKLSPLSALDAATYSSLAADGNAALSARLPAFCAAARLFCTPAAPLLGSLESHHSDANFVTYEMINFTNYGTGRAGGLDSFKNYSDGLEAASDNKFRSYSRSSVGHDDSFLSYSNEGNVVSDNFTSYGSGATGGTGDFTNYEKDTNIPNLNFNNYETDSNGRQQQFNSYSNDTNFGQQSFSGYGKNGNGVGENFNTYAGDQYANVINSTFSNYGESANGEADVFTSYASGFANVPQNKFQSYGKNGNVGSHTFSSYRNNSNVGGDSFASYGKSENVPLIGFKSYGEFDNGGGGSDHFKSYDEGFNTPNVSFKSYNDDDTHFKGYAKTGVDFKTYRNSSVVPHFAAAAVAKDFSGEELKQEMKSAPKHRSWVEPGKFFRESKLRKGTVMPMPDIRDKMPARSFLPRTIAAKIPFSAADVREVFGFPAEETMGKAVADTVTECERAPSRGESKRCATSAEDMIDFAASVLGSGAVARSTESASGSKGDILIGEVSGVDGGKLTHSVSCHQSLFPYLVYYCHSVPKVRVYEAEILSVESKQKINQGVAICHIDTSDWSAGHGAFVALGSTPGKIEVCHWIFQGDLTWTVQN